jgi:hypothetical protein
MEHKGRETIVIEQLLRELDELRELDRRRNAHAPGSAAHDAATLEVDLRSRRLMDRFRDLKERQSATAPLPPVDWTRPVEPRDDVARSRGSLLN